MASNTQLTTSSARAFVSVDCLAANASMSSLLVIPLAPLLGPWRSAAKPIGITEVSGSSTPTLFPGRVPLPGADVLPAADDRPVQGHGPPGGRRDPPGVRAVSAELDRLAGEVETARRLRGLGPCPASHGLASQRRHELE